MNIHYFQRFAQRENVATNNTMLLLQRLYYYSPNKFEKLLRKLLGDECEEFDIGIKWQTQLKCENSVPDAQIRQNSFNILVETKLERFFDMNQMERHIGSFDGKDNYQIMLTLSPFDMEAEQKTKIDEIIKLKQVTVIHKHITFDELIQLIDNELDDNRDSEFYEILNDFEQYCSECYLLNNADNVLRVVPAGVSYEDNIKYNLYYDKKENGYVPHSFIGLYKDKAVRQVGKIKYVIDVEIENDEVVKSSQEMPDEVRNNILEAVKKAKEYGYNIESGHRFFIVDKFYETNFEKVSKFGIMGKRKFFIDSIIGRKAKNAEELAELLKDKHWN